MSTTFGDTLKANRDAASMTMKRLADASGLVVSYIFRLEHRKRAPSRKTVAALIRGLGLGDSDEDQARIVSLWVRAGFVPDGWTVTELENDDGRVMRKGRGRR